MKKNFRLPCLKNPASYAIFIALSSLTWNAFAQQGSASGTAQRAPSAQAQDIKKMYGAGDYSAVARLGSARLAAEPNNHELRYMVANSYAWTGKLDQAAVHYKALSGTSYASQANLGLANVYRWGGMPGLALPLYRQAHAANPNDKEVSEGLNYALRELRPRTQGRLIWAEDSLDTIRKGAVLAQRWTDASSRHGFELELGALQDKRNALKVNQRDLTLRYSGLATPLKPRAEISIQESPRSKLFGAAEAKLPNLPITLSAGHINWGKLAFDPNALQANLWANRIGVQTNAPSEIGTWNAGYFANRISDSNTIQDAYLQFTPAWQPIKVPEVKFFVGFEGRKARFNSPAYWSPRDGNYLGTIGVNANWQDTLWERGFLIQYGAPLGGEAVNSYSVSAGAKRWFNNNWAVGFNIATQRSQRTGSYRATSAMLSVEGLW